MLSLLSDLIGEEVIKIDPVAGGDTHLSYRVLLKDGSVFLKTNRNDNASYLLDSEYSQLSFLQEKIPGHVPEVLDIKSIDGRTFLFIEYIETADYFSSHLSLAVLIDKLHNFSSAYYGWEKNNYIGLLPQRNNKTESLKDFMDQERWSPQVIMARDNGYLTGEEVQLYEGFLRNVSEILPDDGPHLVHGDLWSGNYFQARNGVYYLCDPALYYGHREMDLAMMKLFKGFHDDVYNNYEEISGIDPLWRSRTSIFQLYPLMVHLNLFGLGYKSQVMEIIHQYA